MPASPSSRSAPTAPTPADIDAAATRRNFLIAHFVSGLGWAYFASLGCDACQVDQFTVIKAVVILLAIAATALIASSLRGALIVTFALPVGVYAYTGIKPWVTVEAIMVGLLILSLPFFSYVAEPAQQIGADAAVLPHARRTR